MKKKFRQDNRMNMIFSKSLAEFIFLLHIKKSNLSCSSCQKNEGKQTGFTLLEVLIALVILSVGLLGLASLTASVIRTNSFSDDFTTATALAQDKLEELVNTSFGSLSSSNDTVNADGSSGSKYTRTWTIGAGTATKTIQVDISWTNDYGNSSSISVYTIKSSQT